MCFCSALLKCNSTDMTFKTSKCPINIKNTAILKKTTSHINMLQYTFSQRGTEESNIIPLSFTVIYIWSLSISKCWTNRQCKEFHIFPEDCFTSLIFNWFTQIDFLKDFAIAYNLRRLLYMNLETMSHKFKTKIKQDFATSYFQSQFSIKIGDLNYCGDIHMFLLLGVAYS